MPRRPTHNSLVAQVASHQDGLITTAQLLELGVSSSTLSRRNHVGGMWNRVLPGVHLLGGEFSDRQRMRAALLYAGPEALLTAYTATSLYGLRSRPSGSAGLLDEVAVLIPHAQRRANHSYVRIERTTRMPEPSAVSGLACAPVARAVADAARGSTNRADVLALVTESVRRGLVDVRAIKWELEDCNRRGTQWLREALDHVVHGTWSAPEAHLRAGFVRLDAPQPYWNARLETVDGSFLAIVDGYFEDVGLAVEVDSRAHHSSDDDWRNTLDRSARLSACGILVMHLTTDRIWNDVDSVVRDILAARAALAGRPRPHVSVTSGQVPPR